MNKNDFLYIFCKKKGKNDFSGFFIKKNRQKNINFSNFMVYIFFKKIFLDKKVPLPRKECNSAPLYRRDKMVILKFVKFACETISRFSILIKNFRLDLQNKEICRYGYFLKIDKQNNFW